MLLEREGGREGRREREGGKEGEGGREGGRGEGVSEITVSYTMTSHLKMRIE